MLAVILALCAVPFVGSQAARGESGGASGPLLTLWGSTSSACFRKVSDRAVWSRGPAPKRPIWSPSRAELSGARVSRERSLCCACALLCQVISLYVSLHNVFRVVSLGLVLTCGTGNTYCAAQRGRAGVITTRDSCVPGVR